MFVRYHKRFWLWRLVTFEIKAMEYDNCIAVIIIETTLIQMMACRLFGTNLLSGLIMASSLFGPDHS